MEQYKEQLQKYLPEVEAFLTQLLLEETKISIASFEEKEADAVSSLLQKNDIILYTRDSNSETDFIAVLDEEWFGLLSSVMLGVEEKKFNEVTRDLLKKFSSEFSTTLKKKLTEDKVEFNLEDVEVYQLNQLKNIFKHSSYFLGQLEVEGLADDNVRAAFLVGNPEAQLKEEEEDNEKKNDTAEKAEKKNKTKFVADKKKENSVEGSDKHGHYNEVVSAKYIEFEDFEDSSPELKGSDGNSMELLKDVEMDVSVELGRIELPLGKVLQLAKGSVIELEKLAGEPVDILVNGQRIAHGEVVVIDEHFGVRISNLITTRQRIAKLS